MTMPSAERFAVDNPRLVWAAAIIVAAIGSWIMFDAVPGINWGIWTAAASIGLIIVARDRGRLDTSTLDTLGIATLLGIGAAVTADPFISALICLGVIVFLALAMLLTVKPGLHRLSAPFVITSPVIALGTALSESFTRLVDITRVFHSDRARGVVRGIAITVPIVLFFALLLASADPIFANWRDALQRIVETWSFIPRTAFFIGLLAIVLGAYGFAARAVSPDIEVTPAPGMSESLSNRRPLGATERLILISAVAALFWLFIGVQLSYLFGNVPSTPGSGMSFAEYAQHGFGELTIVATCSIILILASERYGKTNGQARKLKVLTMALLLGVLILLGSAFRRVLLYESAYGFTVSRLYAQVYMIVLAIALIALAAAVLTTLDTSVLFRRVFAVATFAFAVLVFWNHEGWIASANIDRYKTTGKLDVTYITRDLSPNAVPAVVSALATLPEPMRTQLYNALAERYRSGRRVPAGRWFEWNYRRQQAREALARAGLKNSPVVGSTRPGT